jgi:hypothetical protein
MTDITTDLRAALSATPGTLLCGWRQISIYCKKSPRSLRKYRQVAAFPAFRWGRNVYADTRLIGFWLSFYASEQAKRKLLKNA